MSNIHWESVIGQIDDRYIQEAAESYELPASATASGRKKENLLMQNNKTRRGMMRLGSLAAAIALIFTLGVTAYAAGFFDSIIARMSGAYATPDEARDARYEAAAEISSKEPETVDLGELAGTAMTLEESFYDGESLMLAYTLDSMAYPIDYGFDASDERYAKLEKLDSVSMEWFRSSFDISDADYEEICSKIEENGEVSFILTRIGLGDHVLLTDGTDIGPMTYMEIDGSVFLEPQDGLPEKAKNRDQLDIVFTVNCQDICFRIEGENIYTCWPQPQSEKVTFTIPRIAK